MQVNKTRRVFSPLVFESPFHRFLKQEESQTHKSVTKIFLQHLI